MKYIYIVRADGLAYACSNLRTARRVFYDICADWESTCKLVRKLEDYSDCKYYVYETKGKNRLIVAFEQTKIIED